MNYISKKVEFSKPLLILLIFTLGVTILLGLLSQIDRHRKERIYQTYATETEGYIERNRDHLIVLFTILGGENPPCMQGVTAPPYCPLPTRQEQIKKLTQDLKDWSSTAFLHKSRFSEAILITRLSGESQEAHIYPPEKETLVKRLLGGEVQQIPWDDYVYELANKEVTIPVKDTSGRVIGAIIRGIIEQNSF